jgi:hypothetical protein
MSNYDFDATQCYSNGAIGRALAFFLVIDEV